MATTSIDALFAALARSDSYPKNLRWQNTLEHSLKAVEDQLSQRSRKLFVVETTLSQANVGLFQLYGEQEGFRLFTVGDLATLEAHLRVPSVQRRPDPRQRMFFVNARHSRTSLSITRSMLLKILTYHTVMPTFLEFVFPFGKQNNAKDFHLMGFRSASRYTLSLRGLQVDDLGRSGRYLEFCYSLKSVEKGFSESEDRALHWSIRQCSIYHYFDLKTQRAVWIVVKGNQLVSEAFQHRAKQLREQARSGEASQPSAFAESLGNHNIVASWAGENWHWYISDLETYLQDKTEAALSVSWDIPAPVQPTSVDEPADPDPMATPQRTSSWRSIHQRVLSWSTWRTASTQFTGTSTTDAGTSAPQASGFDNFSFLHLQNTHWVEERVNEVLLVLQANKQVLQDMCQEYKELLQDNNGMTDASGDWKNGVAYLARNLGSIVEDMEMQCSRAKSLLRLVDNRKSLLNGILQYRSMQTNRRYADNAALSADRMENMTKDMHIIAKKTKEDTVSMKIITWVTLFFLPGTFISTLMSTPIINFPENKNDFSSHNIGVGALKLYLAISLPLVLLTLLAWGVFSLRERKREKKQQQKALNEKVYSV